MPTPAQAAARHFLDHETEFHLGFLPTEQAHPDTRTLEADFRRATAQGVRTLQRPDQDVLAMARRVLAGDAFARLVADGERTFARGGRIVFSGCGATGRLSILLEAMWRTFRAGRGQAARGEVLSLMTGGDFALIKSVESFEDYAAFGRRQVAELDFRADDMLVAITEGGETSSVLGTVREAAARGGAVHLVFNNPADLLRERLVRCREALDDPRVSVLDLSCGPMALAGSTRMQATTSEQLVAGAFLETLAARQTGEAAPDAAEGFARTLAALTSDEGVARLAERIDFEADVYARGGRVTYLADDYLLDLFTDTTERSPTFMLPPFRRADDTVSPLPWAFVKNPLAATPETWRRMLGRPPRCLRWTADDYRVLGADAALAERPPALDEAALFQYAVGNEPAPERFAHPASTAIVVKVAGAAGNDALDRAARAYPVGAEWVFAEGAEATPLALQKHLALKLALNTISTGVMVKLGRVSGNWMSWVGVSNKKLIDRATRLVAELGGLAYDDACYALFDAIAAVDADTGPREEKPSAVQVALQTIARRKTPWLEEASAWRLSLRDGAGAEELVEPAHMRAFAAGGDDAQRWFRWRGHDTLGEDLAVRVDWRRTDDGETWDGRLSYEGYAGSRFIDAIQFPTLRAPLREGFRFLFGGWDMGFHASADVLPPPGKGDCWAYSAVPCAALLAPDAGGAGWYVDHLDPAFHAKAAVLETSADGRDFTYRGVYYLPREASPSAAGAVPYASGCAPFAGGWFEAAQRYKRRRGAEPAQPRDGHPLRDIGLWVWNRGAAEDVIAPVERLADLMPDVPLALDWYWWHHNPYDTDYPDFWPPREGEEAFARAVARLRRRGIYAQVYTNGVCWDMDGPTWGEGGAASAAIRITGEPHAAEFNVYNHHRLAFMCGEAPLFHDRIAALAGRLRATGLSGHYLDMIGGATVSMGCHHPGHRHPKGGGRYMAAGYRRLLERLKAENPDFPLTTENANEAYADLFDGAIVCNSTSSEHLGIEPEIVPFFSAVHHGRMALFGGYAHFDGIPPWDPLWPPEDRWPAEAEEPWHLLYPHQFFVEYARSIVWGAQPMVCKLTPRFFDDAAFKAHVAFVVDGARLYHRNREFLFDGEMLSPAGFACDPVDVEFMARMIFTKRDAMKILRRTLPAILHGRWRASDGRAALFMANITPEPRTWRFGRREGTLAGRSWQRLDE